MAAGITDDEWDTLSPENFETPSLLRTVDAVDGLRQTPRVAPRSAETGCVRPLLADGGLRPTTAPLSLAVTM